MEWQQASPPDDRGVLVAQTADRIAVDDDVVRREGQVRQRAAHRQDGGVIDVDGVDLVDRCRADADREGAVADAHGEALAEVARQALGVIDAADGAGVGRHDDGACDDGARERAPSDFIDPGEQRSARLPERLLDAAPASARDGHGRVAECYFAAPAVVRGAIAFISLMRVALPVRWRR